MNTIREIIEDRIIIHDEKKRYVEKEKERIEKENIISQGTLSKKKYNYINAMLPFHKMVDVVKDEMYEIESPKSKDRLIFECIKSGKLKIHYMYLNGNDQFSFRGTAMMKINEDLTKGVNNG